MHKTNWICYLVLSLLQRDHILLEPTGTDVTNCVSKGKSQVSSTLRYGILLLRVTHTIAGLCSDHMTTPGLRVGVLESNQEPGFGMFGLSE